MCLVCVDCVTRNFKYKCHESLSPSLLLPYPLSVSMESDFTRVWILNSSLSFRLSRYTGRYFRQMFLIRVVVRATEGFTFVARRIFRKNYLIPLLLCFITFFFGKTPHINYSRKVTHGSFQKPKQYIFQRDI